MEWEPVGGRQILATSRALHPGRSWASLAQTIYFTAFALGLAAILFWSLWKRVASFMVDVASPYQLFWGPAAVALVLLGILRYNTMQGFVTYSEADCLLLLSAPVSRSELIRPQVRRVAVVAGIAGALVGLLAGLASGGLRGGSIRMVEGIAAGAALGIVAVAAGWHVQRVPSLSTWVLRLTIPALVVVGLLAFADRRGGTAHLVALWSGPWGWGLLPLGTRSWESEVAGPVMLWVVAGVGWVSVRRSAGRLAVEGLLARAQTRARMVAAAYAFDMRSVILAGRRPWAERWRARLGLRPSHTASLALLWHSLLVLLRSPVRLVWGVALAAAGALLLAGRPGAAGTPWAAGVAFYLSASSLVESIRLEVDQPGVSAVLLPWRFGTILWRHCLLPVVTLVVIGLATTLVGWASGFAAARSAAAFAILAIPLGFVAVLGAALSARRGGRLPQNVLLMSAGDISGFSVFLMIGWVLGWALLAIVGVGVAALTLTTPNHLTRVITAAVILAVLALVLQSVLARSKR
jgi:hypothetical protein